MDDILCIIQTSAKNVKTLIRNYINEVFDALLVLLKTQPSENKPSPHTFSCEGIAEKTTNKTGYF